jgi:predicted CopG family antitoxin
LGTKNISLSDEAYSRLAAEKKENESFTDVVNRLTGKRSILEIAGILTKSEGKEIRNQIEKLRKESRRRIASSSHGL